MTIFGEESLLVREYERRLEQVKDSAETALSYKWLILAATQGDRVLRCPGEVEVSEEEEEAIHELFRKARAAKLAAQAQKAVN